MALHLVEGLRVAAFPPRPDPPAPNRRLSLEWQKAAPRWLLIVFVLVVVPGQLGYIVWVSNRMLGQYEAQANADGPSKAEIRLVQRLTTLEADARTSALRGEADRAATKELQLAIMQQWKATTDLTWQVKMLTEALNADSRRK